MVPYGYYRVGVFDTSTMSVTTITGPGTSASKYTSGHVVGNRMYMCPRSATTVGVVDLETDTWSTKPLCCGLSSGGFFGGTVVGTRVYCGAFETTDIGVIDTW